jgi:hypothetical protein
MQPLDQITTALEQAIQGEPAPSFNSPEFRQLVSAISSITGAADNRLESRLIGRKALSLLLSRLNASMQSERAVAVMRDNGENLC